MLTHQNLTANARQVDGDRSAKGERDVIMGVLPLFHVFANVCVLNRTVATAAASPCCRASMPARR
jgi:long-chain acyl-CoA synthetase